MTDKTTSYWQSTTPYIPLSTNLPPSVDVAVIGGGIVGAATSYWLAREGIQTALIERQALAYGATGRNGGFVVAGPAESYQDAITNLGRETARAILQLTSENQTLLQQVIKEEKIECGYQEPGALRLVTTELQLEALREEAELMQIDGLATSIIGRAQVQELIYTPLAPNILGGQLVHAQGTVHSAKLVQGLVLAAMRYGARAYKAEVSKLIPHDNSIEIHTTTSTLRARIVIVATNAWTNQIIPSLKDIIIPVREQMLAYAPIAPVFTTSVAGEFIGWEYWQQRDDGTILIGGCGRVENDERMRCWESEPTNKVQHALEKTLPQFFPELTQLHVTQRWAGLLDYTTDSFPIVDQIPEMPGVFIAAGFSGHGMPFGMKFGQLLAETAENGIVHQDLKPYRLNRSTLKKWDQ